MDYTVCIYKLNILRLVYFLNETYQTNMWPCVGAHTQVWDCVFVGCTFHIMSDGHTVRLSSKKTLKYQNKICLLQLSVQRTTPENYYLWLHSGGGACVPVVGVCCIMWMRVKQEGGGKGVFLYGCKSFCPSQQKPQNVHSWIPPLKYVAAERSRAAEEEGRR